MIASARKCKENANRLSLEKIGRDMRLCGICVSVFPVGKRVATRL